jgi:hypothetical protein
MTRRWGLKQKKSGNVALEDDEFFRVFLEVFLLIVYGAGSEKAFKHCYRGMNIHLQVILIFSMAIKLPKEDK